MSQSCRFVLKRSLTPRMVEDVRMDLAAFVRNRYRLHQEDGITTVHIWRDSERALLTRSLGGVIETIEAED